MSLAGALGLLEDEQPDPKEDDGTCHTVFLRISRFEETTMAASPWVFDVTEAEFADKVLKASRDKPIVVDFWAPWCQPCLALGPVLERLIDQRKGKVLLAKVNVDNAPRLAQHFEVQSIPAIKAFRDGAIVLEFEGVLPEQHLKAFLDRISQGEGAEEQDDLRAVEQADPATAEQQYRNKLAAEPENDAARIGLARVLLAMNRTEEIPELLAAVRAEGDLAAQAQGIAAQLELHKMAAPNGDEAAARKRLAVAPDNAQALLELGTVLAASGQYEQALAMLLSAAERDFKLAPTKVRETMVQVFYALGTDHPLANDYRARLARLLY
jgi:putative thioredoxin